MERFSFDNVVHKLAGNWCLVLVMEVFKTMEAGSPSYLKEPESVLHWS